jgi:acetamidase/formamidase
MTRRDQRPGLAGEAAARGASTAGRAVYRALMRGIVIAIVLVVLAGSAHAEDLSGEWIFTEQVFGLRRGARLVLKQDGARLAGTLSDATDDLPVTGAVDGARVTLNVKPKDPVDSFELAATLGRGGLAGQATHRGKQAERNYTAPWTATRMPANRPAAPRTHTFTPTAYHREISPVEPPVLRVWPGDIIKTTSVDAAGVDAAAKVHVLGGNPLTGPFYVETAMPGDVLAVKIRKLALNRDYAFSGRRLVDRALTRNQAEKLKDLAPAQLRWTLDRARGIARLADPPPALAGYTVPVRPMLGCVGVAPRFDAPPISTRDEDYFGGNLDFADVTDGATVLLPVSVPGALLYLGDAHAVQGDGEVTGAALETSLDIEVSVEVLRGKRWKGPRVETDQYIMSLGLDGSLDAALARATSDLADWLQSEYRLRPEEVPPIFGTALEYRIAEIADRNVNVVARLRKERLAGVRGTAP